MGENFKINVPINFTVEEAAEFRSKINKLIESGTIYFTFDFSECNFIDSTGLGTLVSIYKKCVEKGGNIQLRLLKPEVRNMFKLTRLDKVFDIE